MRTIVTEVAPELFRISTFVAEFDLQFNQFLVRDDEPLLYHTGMVSLFPAVRDAVATLIDPAALRWIAYSHFEADECGALNHWLAQAPNAQAVTGLVGAMVNLNDFAVRPPLVLTPEQALETGSKCFRHLPTPHLPHCWDAGMLFEERDGSLFCSDLLHQLGDVEPLTETADLAGRFEAALKAYGATPFANYLVYTALTERQMDDLAALPAQTLLPMHGSSYRGAVGRVLGEAKQAMKSWAVQA